MRRGRRRIVVVAVTFALIFGAWIPSGTSPAVAATGHAGDRGLLAIANHESNSGPYGAPLIDGCQWATWVARCQNLTVYGNGPSFGDAGCGPPNGCTFGPEFQCTELAQRYAYYAWGEPAVWDGFGGAQGSAYQMWNAGPALPNPLEQFAQGGQVLPQQGDLMIFGPGWLGSYWDANGHVAVVTSVGSTNVDIVQENGTPSGADQLGLSGSTVLVNGYTPVIGWLHNPMMSSTARSKLSVAFTAKDEMVFWKGSDGHLRESWSSAGTWNGPADWSSTWNDTALLTSAPSAVSTPGGVQSVFWRGSGGHLWEATYNAGWTAPVDLSASWTEGQMLLSAPAAALTPEGGLVVFWQASNGDLDEAWTSGPSWTGPADWSAVWGGGMALNSSPTVVVTAAGAQIVSWQSVTGHLVSAAYAGGWNPPLDVLHGWTSPMASAPSAVMTADGTELVAWQGTDGHMWGAWYRGSWNGPSLWDGLGSPQTAPSAALGPTGQAVVSWQGANGDLVDSTWTRSWSGTADWTSVWGDRGLLTGAPAATMTAAGQQLVFWRGAGGHLWESWYSGAWNGPVDWSAQWQGAGLLASSPSVALTPDGQQLLFWTGPDGHLWEAWFDGKWNGPVDWTAAWGSQSSLGSAPSVTVTARGQQLVFWRGSEGDLWEAWFNGSWNGPVDWSNVFGRGHPLASAPSSTLGADGSQQIVYWRDTSGHLEEIWFTAAWNGPVDWTGSSNPGGMLSSAPSAAVTPSEQQIFWQGSDGHLWETWWSGVMSAPVDWASGGVSGLMASSPSVALLNGGQEAVFWESPAGHLLESWWGGPWAGTTDLSGAGQLS